MKIAVFVDYWNLQLTLNEELTKKNRISNYRSKIDWKNLGPLFVKASAPVLGVQDSELTYEGCYIYTSFNPGTDEGKKFKSWATTWLDRQPGVNVHVRERKPKAPPRCPSCHKEISHCPHNGCGKPIVGTVEKGIDTLLVTDLIRLAMAGTYDAAVIASSDADMVPAVEFVQTQNKKIIQAGFPPKGVDLATECWGSFNVMDLTDKIERAT